MQFRVDGARISESGQSVVNTVVLWYAQVLLCEVLRKKQTFLFRYQKQQFRVDGAHFC